MNRKYLKITVILFYCLNFVTCYENAFVKSKKYSYLDDIINEIKSETWDESEATCKYRTLSLLQNVQNFTLWATWAWDSMNTKPVGSLYGSQYHLGNFDQCLSPWISEDNPELRTKYCLANIQLEGESYHNNRGLERQMFNPYGKADAYIHTPTGFQQDLGTITWGVCVPESCHSKSIERFVSKLLKNSQFGSIITKAKINIESCEVAERGHHYTIEDHLFFGLVGILLCFAVVTTYLFYQTHHSRDSSRFLEFACCFSIPSNFRKLTDTNKEEIRVMNGIRFMTSALVVFLHQVFIIGAAAFCNGVEIEELLNELHTSWLLHSDIVVDTFFMMSGLLLVSSCMSMKEITVVNLGKQLVKRYFRLATTLAVMILYVTTIAKYTGSGPLWLKTVGREFNSCKKNWWLSLLMINNYIDRENLCFPVSWSTSCDFHFSIVGSAVVYVYNKNRQRGVLIFVTIFSIALALPGIYTELYQHPPLFVLNSRVLKNYRIDPVFMELYIPSHNRFAAYLVGMMFGFVFSTYKPRDFTKSITKCWSIVTTCVALGVMIGIIRLGKSYYSREYSRVEAVLYAALNRPLWAFAVALIIFSCVYGTVPLVKDFLSWPTFRPLSRLTYGVYMVHSLIYMSNTFSVRSPQHLAFTSTLIEFLGVLVLSCSISLLLWLTVEAPAANIINLFLSKGKMSSIIPKKETDKTTADDKLYKTDSFSNNIFEIKKME